MQQNFYAVRNKNIVSSENDVGYIRENIVAVFQKRDDAICFQKATAKINPVNIFSKDELIDKAKLGGHYNA